MPRKKKTSTRTKRTFQSWGRRAPKRGKAREKLYKECGRKCFLLPSERKFPVCPSCRNSRCTCKPDCKGLIAAIIRGNQHGYPNVVRRAKRMYKKHGCSTKKKKKKSSKRRKSSKKREKKPTKRKKKKSTTKRKKRRSSARRKKK